MVSDADQDQMMIDDDVEVMMMPQIQPVCLHGPPMALER